MEYESTRLIVDVLLVEFNTIKPGWRSRHRQNREEPDWMFGGARRDRTVDLLVANEALSQLSYSPNFRRELLPSV
jgi:hypothetical protein